MAGAGRSPALDDPEVINHHATAQTGKGLGGGDTLARGACDGEGGVTLAAKADARVGGRVLDEDGGLLRRILPTLPPRLSMWLWNTATRL